MSVSKEQELFEQAKKGDEQSFRRLFNLMYPALCSYAHYFIQSAVCAEEIVADVFVKVWRVKEGVDSGAIKAYLYRSVKNSSLNELSRQRIDTVSLENEVINEPEADTTPLQVLLAKEAHLRMNQLIDQLPERRRLIFTMSRVEGIPFREIAELLDISVRTVEDQVFKAVKYLREAYQKSGRI